MNAPDPLAAALADLERRDATAEQRENELEAELATVKAQRLHHRGAIDHIKSLIQPSTPLSPIDEKLMASVIAESVGRQVKSSLAGMDAVAAALKDSPNALTLAQLTAAVHALGWRPDAEDQERAVRAAANRLRRKDSNFDYVNKLWLYRPRHTGHLPPRLGEGDP